MIFFDFRSKNGVRNVPVSLLQPLLRRSCRLSSPLRAVSLPLTRRYRVLAVPRAAPAETRFNRRRLIAVHALSRDISSETEPKVGPVGLGVAWCSDLSLTFPALFFLLLD